MYCGGGTGLHSFSGSVPDPTLQSLSSSHLGDGVGWDLDPVPFCTPDPPVSSQTRPSLWRTRKQVFSHTAGSHATLGTHLGSYVSRNVRLTFIRQ